MDKIKIYSQPMTEVEQSENIGKVLRAPVRYHLIDCLKNLKFGRPADDQNQLDKMINELATDLEKGVPFT